MIEDDIREALQGRNRLAAFAWHVLLVQHGPDAAIAALEVVARERGETTDDLLPDEPEALE